VRSRSRSRQSQPHQTQNRQWKVGAGSVVLGNVRNMDQRFLGQEASARQSAVAVVHLLRPVLIKDKAEKLNDLPRGHIPTLS
jgi:hypothetical protein